VTMELMAVATGQPCRRPPDSGDVAIPEHGHFKISEFAQFLNRVGAFMEPTVELPPEMPVIAEYMEEWKKMAVSEHEFANDTVEARSGSGSEPDLAVPTSVSGWLSGMTTAAKRMGARWTADPKLNNVWKRLSYQINCFWKPGYVVTGDCEDLALHAVEMMVSSGLLSGAPPGVRVSSIGLAACVVQKNVDLNGGGPTVLGETSELSDVSDRTAHMVVAIQIGDRIYVADATSRNPVWKWCGRVYWLLMSPYSHDGTPTLQSRAAPGASGTSGGLSGTYFLADTSRGPGGAFAGIDIEPGGSFPANVAAGAPPFPSPLLVPLAACDGGRRMIAQADAVYSDI